MLLPFVELDKAMYQGLRNSADEMVVTRLKA